MWLVKLKNPEFTLQLKDLNVQQGEQIEFTCKLQMHPNFNMGRTEHIKIEWQINDLRIVDTPQTRVLMEPDGTNRLIVPDADVGDSGTFHCIATNILTGHSEVTSCKLKVIPNEPGKHYCFRERSRINLLLPNEVNNFKVPLDFAVSIKVYYHEKPRSDSLETTTGLIVFFL